MKAKTAFLVPLLLAAIAMPAMAEARTFHAKVSRFQRMATLGGETFVIKPMNDPSLARTLEFESYAAKVSTELTALGYQPAAPDHQAALVVTIDYGVDQGREKLEGYWDDWGAGGWGGWGNGGWGWGWGGGWPAWGGGGWGEMDTYTVYGSKFDMSIARAHDGTQIFQGRARANTRQDSETVLVPSLIRAMFTGFPGESGKTVRVKVKTSKKER